MLDHRGKFTPTYEGPYVVKKAFSRGALILFDMDGHDFNMPTNSDVIILYFAWRSLSVHLISKFSCQPKKKGEKRTNTIYIYIYIYICKKVDRKPERAAYIKGEIEKVDIKNRQLFRVFDLPFYIFLFLFFFLLFSFLFFFFFFFFFFWNPL